MPELIVRGYADSSTGYGQMTARLLDGLEVSGLKPRFSPIWADEGRLPIEPALRDRLIDRPAEGPVLLMGGPWESAPIGSIHLTMWEATSLPAVAAETLNARRAIVVPCRANVDWFRASGVTVPIHVVPLGIDPTVYHPRGRIERPGAFLVGAAGRVGDWECNRKGLDRVARAFLEAFPNPSRARLEIKTWADCRYKLGRHPRIRQITTAWTDHELADWYRSLDIFASASKGEGWGLQPHQAMACGAPTIAPIWGGHAAYMTPATTWPVAYSEEPAGAPYQFGVQPARWCISHHESLVEQLRQAEADNLGRRAKAEAAASRAAEFTWERSSRELAAVVREYGLGRGIES